MVSASMSDQTPNSSPAADALAAEFATFLAASPSSFHAAAEVLRQLEHAGFTRLSETEPWLEHVVPGAKLVVLRDGAVIAAVIPKTVATTTPVRLIGSHTDSPGFAVKPEATFSAFGFSQVAVEVYGGPILDTWFDRELEFAGRLVDNDGREHLVRSGAIARIPQLAIHLDRSANDTRTIDRQRHVQPILGVTTVDLIEHLASTVDLQPSDVAAFNLISVDTQAAAQFGQDAQLFASGRLDNLTSVFASLKAITAAARDVAELEHIAMLAAFDHEEVGSESRSGASGPFLDEALDRIFEALGANRDDRARALAASWCVSADAAHSVHPNFSEKHDPNIQPVLGSGPVLKINANQRYATDAVGSAFWRACAERAGAPVQQFVSNNTIPCGSTIGPLTATRLGIRTVDVGVPLLSMHSARELCHLDDLQSFTRVLERVLV